MTDTERLDWIERELWRRGGGTFSVRRGRGGPLIAFTVRSQHVPGRMLREVIDALIKVAEVTNA